MTGQARDVSNGRAAVSKKLELSEMKKRGTKICCSVCSILSIVFLVLAIVIFVLNQTGFIKEKVDDIVLEVWSDKAFYNVLTYILRN